AAVAGGDLYYVGRSPPAIRRVHGDIDESFLPITGELTPYLIAASPAGDRLAMMSSSMASGNRLCVIDLATRTLSRLPQVPLANGRMAFSADGSALYYATPDGIRRMGVDGIGDQEVVAGADASSGIAVAPAGDLMVWSDCIESGPVKDLGERPATVVIDERIAYDTATGPAGELAYVPQPEAVLRLRTPDGRRRDLTDHRLGHVTSPGFSPDGRRLVFRVNGASSGLYVIDLEPAAVPEQITEGDNDRSPYWLDADTIVFERYDDRDQPVPYTVSARGGQARPVRTRPAMPVGVLRRTGELLLAAPGFARIWWLDLATGLERDAPSVRLPRVPVVGMSLSTDGRWAVLRGGRIGQLIYRLALDPPGRPELVYGAADDESVRSAAIDPRGHVIAAPMRFQGELHAIAAAPGQRF
ncbi:MAG TPA: hypothetical protein VL172_02840, partial [Kofleriaceae bacterium]|nr:hypothetical protein [Kofleriaceae bacterium]